MKQILQARQINYEKVRQLKGIDMNNNTLNGTTLEWKYFDGFRKMDPPYEAPTVD